MATTAFNENPYSGNSHTYFDGGGHAPYPPNTIIREVGATRGAATSRHGSLLHNQRIPLLLVGIVIFSRVQGNDIYSALDELPAMELNCPVSTNALESFRLSCIPENQVSSGGGGLAELLVREIDHDPPDSCEIVVVADVVAVTPIAVVGLDEYVRRIPDCGPSAWYRVEVRVRHAIRGSFAPKSLSFPARYHPGDVPGGWLYYRGISLRLGLHVDKRGDLRLLDATLSSAKPHTGGEKIRIARSRGSLPKDISDRIGELPGSDGDELIVMYGPDQLVRYGGGDAIVKGRGFQMPDFGFSSRIDVFVGSGSGQKEEWEKRWFSHGDAFSINEMDSPVFEELDLVP